MRSKVPGYVLEVLVTLKENNYEAYLVGGCVRDLLRGVEPQDWDIATSAPPLTVQGLFPKVIPTGVQFGTVTVLNKGEALEVTTFRQDGIYRDGRHPSTVVFGRDIEVDLRRRDFTINAMAYDPFRDRLVDPVGGRKDLEEGIIRAVGDPWERFREDALRMLRAVRLAGQLEARIEAATWEAVRECCAGLKHIAPERVREELDKILLQEPVLPALTLLDQSGLLALIFPQLYTEASFPLPVSFQACAGVPARLHLRLAALLAGLADPGASVQALRYTKEIIRRVEHLVTHLAMVPEMELELPLIRRYLSRLNPANLADLTLLLRAVVEAGGLESLGRDRAESFLTRLHQVSAEGFPLSPAELAVDGHVLKQELSIEPGPLVGWLLNKLWEEVLQDPRRNQREYLLARARELAGKYKEPGPAG